VAEACWCTEGKTHNGHAVSRYQVQNTRIKVIRVTGRGGPLSCETSRLPDFLENRFTDGGEVVSLTLQSPFTPRKIPGTHFC
jgi:hypothetical protein